MSTNKKQASSQPADYIETLLINDLHGRMLRLPPDDPEKKREILLVYGIHTSLERYFSLAECLNDYGHVTMPDLPGFGGMESFYKIGKKPTLDNMADYLATFVKLRYKNKRFTIVGMSLGFVIVARMLQRYPEIAKRVDILVSLVGFTHIDDFHLSKRTIFTVKWGAGFFSLKLPALLFHYVALQPIFIRLAYGLVADRHMKLKDADKNERRKRINFEIHLWRCNDLRTYMSSIWMMSRLDLTQTQVNLPVYHISADVDHYFNAGYVEQHMRCIFNDFVAATAELGSHAPTVIADVETTRALIPQEFRDLLAQPV